MNKRKIFLFFSFSIIALFLISFSSALEWDNEKEYDTIQKEVTFYNSFLGVKTTQIGKAQLRTPLNVEVSPGYQKVAEFNLWVYEDYDNLLKQFEFQDMKNNRKDIIRAYDLKQLTYEEKLIQDYKTECSTKKYLKNNSDYKSCEQIKTGSHIEQVEKWTKINSENFYKDEQITVGVFTNVMVGDYVDWIPSIYGVKVSEWATWTNSLDVGNLAYYKMDEASGVVVDELGVYNGTTTTTRGVEGIINDSFLMTGSSQNIIITNSIPITQGSINLWINATYNYNDNLNHYIINSRYNTNETDRITLAKSSSNVYQLRMWDSSEIVTADIQFLDENITKDEWNMITITYETNDVNIYINGVLNGTNATATTPSTVPTNFNLGSTDGVIFNFEGGFDEMGIWNRALSQEEINDLYNSGSGLPYQDSNTTIILNSPEDNYATTIKSNSFNCSIESNPQILNLSLWTNSSGTFEIQDTIDLSQVRNSTQGTAEANSFTGTCGVSYPCVNAYDEDYSTLAAATSASGLHAVAIYENYTIPGGLSNAILQTKYIENGAELLAACYNHTTSSWISLYGADGFEGEQFRNITIPFGCLAGTKVNTRTSISGGWSGTPDNGLYETSMIWEVTGYNDFTGILNDTFSGIGTYLWTCEACTSSVCVPSIENRTMNVVLFNYQNITYTNPQYESTQGEFVLNISLTDGETISSASFEYNDTNYTTQIIFSGGRYLISSSILLPSVDADTNYTFRFYITIDGILYALTQNTQEVLNIEFTTCLTYEDLLLNISLFDEGTKLPLSSDLELNLQIYSKTSDDLVAETNSTHTSTFYEEICLSPNESFSNFYLNAELRYSKDDYASEFYYIQKADLADYPRNLSLFDLKLNDSTEFVITYQNDAFIFVEGAVVQLQRKYIGEDTYEVVEAPLTSDGGKAVVHVDLNTNKYRASVVKDGVLLKIFEGIVFECGNELSGECEEPLEGDVDPNNDIPVTELTDFVYSVTTDPDNNTITVLFAVPSGTPSVINVLLGQTDMFGNTTSCNQTVTTSAGSIECSYSDTFEKSILDLSVSKDDSELATLSYIVDEELDFDGMNFFIVFIFMISLVGMAIASPEWMIIISVMVLMISGMLLLLQGMSLVLGVGASAWLIIAAAIIILKMAKQEDR